MMSVESSLCPLTESNASKRLLVSPLNPYKRQALLNSLYVSSPELSLSKILKADFTPPNSCSVQRLNSMRRSCASASTSRSVMKPVWSLSKASQAPVTSKRHLSLFAASWNSCQLQQFELSLSKMARQPFSVWPCRVTSSRLNSRAASSSGDAVSHSGGFHVSRNKKSSTFNAFLSCQSNHAPMCRTSGWSKPDDEISFANCA
mmetsp:Transcript_76503/g.234136  ORF Transcript_76503/g.234136 Transcript_76503/m.234136 type:complete len:203 (+) Transcript_76503:248-856(+)